MRSALQRFSLRRQFEGFLLHTITNMSIPPGLPDDRWVHQTSGGGESTEWRSFETKKYYNTSVVVQGDKVLSLHSTRLWKAIDGL